MAHRNRYPNRLQTGVGVGFGVETDLKEAKEDKDSKEDHPEAGEAPRDIEDGDVRIVDTPKPKTKNPLLTPEYLASLNKKSGTAFLSAHSRGNYGSLRRGQVVNIHD